MKFLSQISINNSVSVDLLEELRERAGLLAQKGRKMLFITVSPNPNATHACMREKNGKDKSFKLAYKILSHKEQHQYLFNYINAVYVDQMETGDWFYYVFETNSDNNLHVHGIMYSKDIQDDYSLKCLQKTVYVHPKTIVNLPKKNPNSSKAPKDYMNNIFYVDESDPTKGIMQKIEYLTKETDIKKHFPDESFGF